MDNNYSLVGQSQYLNNIQFKGTKNTLIGKLKPIKNTILKILSDHNKKVDYIYFNIISNDELLEINKKFLKHNFYTDVVTFNYSENTKIIEGDSYISIDYVKESARELKIKVLNELIRIIIHSTLHMVGYDDLKKEEKAKMTKLENKYIKVFDTFHVEQKEKSSMWNTNNKNK